MPGWQFVRCDAGHIPGRTSSDSKRSVLKTTWLLALILILPAALRAAEPRLITLDEALHLGDASPSAATLSLEVDRARAEVRASGLWPNPEVAVSREEALGTVDRFETLSLPLPLTGRLSLEKSAARSGLKATEARTRVHPHRPTAPAQIRCGQLRSPRQSEENHQERRARRLAGAAGRPEARVQG